MKLKTQGRYVQIRPDNATERELLRRSAWKKVRDVDEWRTSKTEEVACLRPMLSAAALAKLKHRESLEQLKELRSSCSDDDYEVPMPPGVELYPYQRGGIRWLVENPCTLLADDMGLGKTIQVIGLLNVKPELKRILIVCPASLKENWKREIQRFSVTDREITIIQGRKGWRKHKGITILNYDILDALNDDIACTEWDLIVLDESHYIKTRKAKRTTCVLGGKNHKALKANRRVCLTGTPLLNKPVEIYTSLRWLDPVSWPSAKRFEQEFCGWRAPWEDEAGGHSNSAKLQRLMRRSVMIRRQKADVLKDLPPKTRQVIALPPVDGVDQLGAEIKAMVERMGFDKAVANLQGFSPDFAEIAAVRRDTAIAKIPFVIGHVKDLLESVDKVIVFGHHQQVIKEIAEAFKGSVSISGKTPQHKRQGIVDKFQTDPDCRVFVGNIQAAGVGLTLTAASTVVFAEEDWTPGAISQAEDRCHRIGQRDNVLIHHLVFKGSIDGFMIEKIVAKQAVIESCVNV